jgi:hypothetical protein
MPRLFQSHEIGWQFYHDYWRPHTVFYDNQGLDKMLKVCGTHVDYVDIRTGKDSVLEKVEAITRKNSGNRKIRIASTEWVGLDVDKPPINYIGHVTYATIGLCFGGCYWSKRL